MTQLYKRYSYLWPPRPEVKIPTSALDFYENKGWWAQTKKNGTCTLIFANGNERPIFKTRHNDDHKMWEPQLDHLQFFRDCVGWNVYVAELLHSKVSDGPKHELYIFDLLVDRGEYLTGVTFAERMDRLHDRWKGDHEGDQVRVAPRITVATCIDHGFAERFKNLKKEDEGLVLKDPKAKLLPCFKPDSNKSGQVKCRIAHRNYSF